ncbi:putative uncharacterized protein DDB_G0274535 [Abrus precatorius]|uniref:RING-type domain-containing protein n=1 Tax=Abrus precatorius TaxID=3816 RepID=A0A8B8K953_ABRPR|nr:putative uncharacterized protein DDB_G0274535 [Abrus precatorius]
MASAPSFHRNKEAKLLAQNERPNAYSLRSRTKTKRNNQSVDRPSQVSRHENNSVAKKSEVHAASTSRTGRASTSTDNHRNKSNDCKTKSTITTKAKVSSCSTSKDQNTQNNNSSGTQGKQDLKNQQAAKSKASSNCRTNQNSKNGEHKIKSPETNKRVGNWSEKTIPSQNQAKISKKEHMVYCISLKGFEKTSERWNCELCGKDISYSPNEEDEMHEENELQYYFSLHKGEEEQGGNSLLPETCVLPCSHVFHSTCLYSPHLTDSDTTDPPCPLCVTLS